MFKILKIVLFGIICFVSETISAQVDQYIETENSRIIVSKKIEIEIQNFIDDNFYNYKLSQEINDKIIHSLKDENEFTPEELEKEVINTKKHELRKLFFYRNPDKKVNYVATPIPPSVQQLCVNGDFENGLAGYSFWSDAHPQPASGSAFFLSCDTPTALSATNVIAPTTNNFNSAITMIDNASAGYQVNDPTLAGFGVNIPTLNTNGGGKCIKLNNTFGSGSSDLSTVSRYFPSINQSTIDFNFSLIMDNKPDHEQDIQPYFRVRVLDQFNNVVDEICIIANPSNCLFTALNISFDRRILYTGWICARLNVQDILNQPGTIEFSVSDCQPSRHFGTVYIDNICGLTCSAPQLGALNINPTNVNCPDVANNLPFQVCGTYQVPLNSTLNTLTLDILQGGNVVGTINTPTQLTASTFCFTVFPSLFGANPSGNFEFQINATFLVNCSSGTFNYDISTNSSGIGADVTFIDCCVPTLTLTTPADNHNNLAPFAITQRERSDWIKASNLVSFGDNTLANGVVYHAENFVELNPGFEALLGAQFAAYPEGCSGNYTYRSENGTNPQNQNNDNVINLEKNAVGFLIVPNPSSNSIEILMKNAKFKNITITTVDGKIVLERNIQSNNKCNLDVANYANGIYIVNITTEDEQLFTEKLIKN
ncbi:T9SS type A sorting domain-containing protein [Flavobacterium sp.]|uniref:T9SS type A sorting domain-containing protein n=1 Tax=Flavobacterium sp. TaxID=239 RepID=UPI003750678F